MLENILRQICNEMSGILTMEQSEKLKNVLFINFHGKVIAEDKCEIIPSETNSDAEKIKLFWASKKVSGRADSTLKQYINEIRSCQGTIGKSFNDITTMDLRWYLGIAKEKRGNKMSTIQSKIRYLNSFFSFLLDEGLIKENPVARIEKPKTEKVIKKAFSPDDMEAIRKCCTHIRDRAMIEFMYSTGLRVSELVSLNVGDIDMYKKEFTVKGKGNKERTVYFSPAARFYLRDYFVWRMKSEGVTMEQLKNEPLFVKKRSPRNRILKAGVELLCRNIGGKCGIQNVHPHRFRRTFATNMAARGMKLQELAKLMGHSEIGTTMIYCDISQDSIKNSYGEYCA